MSRRFPILALVAIVVAGGIAADRIVERPSTSTAPGFSSTSDGAAVVPPASAVSSTWYCPGGTTAEGSPASATVVVANTSSGQLTGRVRITGTEGEPVDVSLDIPAHSHQAVRLGDHNPSPYAGALVEVDGGGAVVEQSVDGPLGSGATACATSASDRWYFAEGTTAKDASLLLFLLNPFPEDAIADLSFATDQGRAVPADFQGVVVPAGRLTVVDVGSHVRRREAVATSIRTRTGRVVAAAVETRTAAGLAGLSVALGAPALASTWYFPEGMKRAGMSEWIHIYNPASQEAAVDVELTLDSGRVEPLELTIPPGEQIVVDVNAEESIPADVGRSTIVRAVGGVNVVAQRVIQGVAPNAQLGRSVMLGVRRPSARWAMALGGVSESIDEWIVVHNPGRRDAKISLDALVEGRRQEVATVQDLVVGAGKRLAIKVGDHVQGVDLPLLLSSDEAVVVERDIYRLNGPGMAMTGAVPSPEP